MFIGSLFAFLACATSSSEVALTPTEVTESADTSVAEAESYVFFADVDPMTMEPTITFPDDITTHSYDAYADEVYAIKEAHPEADISITFGEQLTARINTELGVVKGPVDEALDTEEAVAPLWNTGVFGYTLSGGSGYNPVAYPACYRVGNYYAVRLNYGSGTSYRQIFDFHFQVYTSGASTCLNVYESVIWRGCWGTCSDPGGGVYSAIYNGAIIAGLGWLTAYTIESLAAPLAVSALAL